MILISEDELGRQFQDIARNAIDAALSSKIFNNPIKVYRREDIAELFKTSVQWVSMAVKKKEIPEPFKKGNVVYWTDEQVKIMVYNK